MKKILFALPAALVLLAAGCKSNTAAEDPLLDDKADISGAAAVKGKFNVPRSPYFSAPDFFNKKTTKTLIILPKFKTLQQSTEYTCAAASAWMVLNYFGKADKTERQLAREMDIRSPENPRFNGGVACTTEALAGVFKKRGFKTISNIEFKTPEEFSEFLLKQLKKGMPVIVNYATWSNHWAVVIGYDTMGTKAIDDDVLILADPYDTSDHCQDGYFIQSFDRFFWNWFDPGVMYGTLVEEQFVAPEIDARTRK